MNRLYVRLPLPSALLVLAITVWSGCSNADQLADAYGNFEAIETIISSEATGKLVAFSVTEGSHLAAGDRVGLVDTLQLSLKKRQIVAARRAVRSQTASVRAQISVLEEQRAVAETEKNRIEQLLQDNAATTKQLDDIEGQLSVLAARINQVRTQNSTILAELEGLDAQIAQLDDQIDRNVIRNPIEGVVLATFSEQHEITTTGRPLYKIANLDRLILRAYLSGSQLPHVALGQEVEVRIDEDESSDRSLRGVVTWIASEAEFTPKLIQTKEERVNLVYAIKVAVENPDGSLKIGMPGEVWMGRAKSDGSPQPE